MSGIQEIESAILQLSPEQMREVHEWLENLLDPSIQTLIRDGGAEKENLSFIQSAKEAGA